MQVYSLPWLLHSIPSWYFIFGCETTPAHLRHWDQKRSTSVPPCASRLVEIHHPGEFQRKEFWVPQKVSCWRQQTCFFPYVIILRYELSWNYMISPCTYPSKDNVHMYHYSKDPHITKMLIVMFVVSKDVWNWFYIGISVPRRGIEWRIVWLKHCM